MKLEAMLVEGLKADQDFQQQLQALKEAHLKQLQETQRRQSEELAKRIHRDALLSTCKEDKSEEERNLNGIFRPSSLRRSSSTSVLASGKGTPPENQPLRRPTLSSPARVTFLTGTTPSRTPPTHQTSLSVTQSSYEHKELAWEAECQKKFRALPVPRHVTLPLYRQMTEQRETRRKQCLDQRKDFLLSSQKPFCFQGRERERREKDGNVESSRAGSSVRLAETVPSTAAAGTAASVKEAKQAGVSPPGTNEELGKKTNLGPHGGNIKNSTAPNKTRNAPTSSSKPRCSDQTKKQMLGFLDEKPSFQPRISQQVPDFSSRHKAFQAAVLRKAEMRDSTKCQPFHLRTSTLPMRQSAAKPANSQEPKVGCNLRKSKSFGCLTSLSTEILPTYISDATRKRGMAIRKTIEMNESRKGQSADWMRSFQMRSQAMQKTVTVRAKVIDPHSSLKDMSQEQLQRHREADQQRGKEYLKELRDMKERVSQRPYLFELVKQKQAKALVERTYRRKLQEAGLNECFVEASS
ncbi:LOW QUALITY PROTEIN: protein FAM161B [Gadus chalcogrammus]|uniref:LOW QUALITY PROTEIN: protein FAM161B n=1 Tax=Gadus chalcogrammus TaxID=1042646 RepID=UPI0024C3E840|nr:LOW QUALITY PROTEIN: protein FAM161B [Gadus chalcogrammus]